MTSRPSPRSRARWRESLRRSWVERVTVFGLLAHGDPTTFNFTTGLLGDSKIVVHVDSRSSLTGYRAQSPRMRYVQDRVAVRWAGFSQVEATLRVYEQALTMIDDPAEHVVLLSGQCVLLRPPSELEHHLRTSPWGQHCRAGRLFDGLARNEQRVLRKWAFDQFDARLRPPMRHINAAARRLVQVVGGERRTEEFDDLTVVAGSNWTALTAACIEDILSRELLVSRARDVLKYAMGPDEIFFHTLLHSTEWGEDTATPRPEAKGDRRTADFSNLHFIHPSLTKFIELSDIAGLRASGRFFGRKADLAATPILMPPLAQMARGQTGEGPPP
ncbi:beta-1,6-N-acetylglucosaminyltransferase [Microbacterium sp. NPDC078428]|uniref:beta-1,6-N-acetylglucosaminyltransferase n=1 Tax=Microbacterium sp. NPDC078428 TaxID=3364190 RepID=UPI0037C98720